MLATTQVKSLRQRRRVLKLSAFGLLLAILIALYASYARIYGRPSVDLTWPWTNPASSSDSESSAPSQGPSVQTAGDAGEDRFILHPERHIFRDATTIQLSWNVTRGQLGPDGVDRAVYLINGQFPGPTVEARSGDELVIDVYNFIEGNDADGLAIHWHGLSMQGANEMDGVAGLTQCAISPGGAFTYRFRIDDAMSGTFWYHAHSGLQRSDGLYGGLVIHRPVDRQPAPSSTDQSLYDYAAEQLLLVGDWYHRAGHEVLDWYQDPDHFGNEPAPDSLLINGKGFFDCSMAVKARPVNCSMVERPTLALTSSGRVRLRIVNTGSYAGFTLGLSHATMKLITLDGGNLVDAEIVPVGSVGVLYPGERMDVVVQRMLPEAPLAGEPELVTVSLDEEALAFTNFALTAKQTFPLQWKGSIDSRNAGDADAIEDHESRRPETIAYLSLENAWGQRIADPDIITGLSSPPSETAVVYANMEIRASHGNRPVGVMNHTSWVVANPLGLPLLALGRDEWDGVTKQPSPAQRLQVPWYKEAGEGRWMELVVNNMDEKGHPVHLHGHRFYVLSRHQAPRGRYEAYNPFSTSKEDPPGGPLNIANPIRKDTVYVPRMGYVVLRFPLDNEGLWLLHCHMLWHEAVGMGMAIQVGEVSADVRARAGERCRGNTIIE